MAIDAFALYSLETDKPIDGYTDLKSGDTINLAMLPAFSLVAIADDARSVRFNVDGSYTRTANNAPFCITSDSDGNITEQWKLPVGKVTVEATA